MEPRGVPGRGGVPGDGGPPPDGGAGRAGRGIWQEGRYELRGLGSRAAGAGALGGTGLGSRTTGDAVSCVPGFLDSPVLPVCSELAL